MYTVNLKDVFTKEIRTIHDINSIDKNSNLLSGKISDAINEISSFEFEILPNNIGFNFIEPFRTQVEVYDNKAKKYVFKGRVLIPSISMSQDGNIVKDVTCEGFLGYLNDVYTPIAEEQTYELNDFIDLLLNHYNSKVEDYKKIYKGTINVQTFASGNTVTKSLDGTQTIYEAIQEKLIDSFGGEIQVVEDNQGILYFNYIQEIGIKNENITIEVGRNMKTATKEIDPTSIYTRLYPYGAKLTKTYINDEGEEVTEETEERLTIESVNNNIPYIEDEQAYSQFKTTLEHAEIFDDITVAENLKTKAEEWLTNNNKVQQKHTISYVDLFKLGIDTSDIELYNYYHIINPLIGIDEMLRVIKKTTDIIDINSSSIDVGDIFKTLTDIEVERQQQIISTINTVQQINKNYTTNLDLSNLKNYMTSYINQTADNIQLGVENIISLANYIKTVENTDYLHLEDTCESDGTVYSLSIKGFPLIETGDAFEYNIMQNDDNVRFIYDNEELTVYPNVTYNEENKELLIQDDFLLNEEELIQENIIKGTIVLNEPLRTLTIDGVTYYDEIVIENNTVYIYRNIGLDENNNWVLLNSTVVTKYGTMQIHTFELDTYIYMQNYQNLMYKAIYITSNPFIENFMTKLESTSKFEITNEQIQSKVNKNGIISAINQTAELIKILASRIALEGYTTINGGFSIDEQGNASIANGAVEINTSGIQMATGTKIVGGDGLMTNLRFDSFSFSENVGDSKSAGEYHWIGFTSSQYEEPDKYNIYIDIDIPDDFTINDAYIKLRHIPNKFELANGNVVYGYARNVKCYISEVKDDIYIEGYENSEFFLDLNGTKYTEISNCFNNINNSFTAQVASSSALNITEVITKDISDSLKQHCRIKIATTDSIPTSTQECVKRTGFMSAVLYITGYMNV